MLVGEVERCVISSAVWKNGGDSSFHSTSVGRLSLEIILRWEDSVSHRMKINIISAMNDIKDPVEEIMFHFVYESG